MEYENHILITGTTSGIGLGILKYFTSLGWKVTAINRRNDPVHECSFPNANFEHFDVQDLTAVREYFRAAAASGEIPSVYFLNAGINRVDNVDGFQIKTFREVMEINLFGVMNFVSEALPLVDHHPCLFIVVSSTSNIFPNPNCLGYFASKLAAHEIFSALDRVNRPKGVRFKSIILGPVATNIFVSGKLASKLQARVRDLITLRVDHVVPSIVRFMKSDRQALFYPKRSVYLYRLLRLISKILPGFYRGSAPPARSNQ